ncbi:MAG: hypothetical protein HFE27_05935 [Clostridia bacterium]|jgi:hypothetical protein|nr:hypothetical protein [Clostridia bacterium]
MKKPISAFLLILSMLPALTACGGYDYSAHISEAKSDLFCAETDEFTVTVSCVSREYPYVADGITCPMNSVMEVSLVPAKSQICDYEVYLLGETTWGGETSFRTYAGDYFYSESVRKFPEGSVTVQIKWEDETRELTATSVKNEKTLSVNEILEYAIKAEKETVKQMTRDGNFLGEFYIRLLRRNINYYYVGITDLNGTTVSLLLDSETGEVLAKRGG